MSNEDPISETGQFYQLFQEAFDAEELVKCTLSKPRQSGELKNIYLRPVTLKKELKIAVTYRYKTRDEVKNHSCLEAISLLEQYLGTYFLNSDLITTRKIHALSISKSARPLLTTRKLSQEKQVDTAHDRRKKRLLEPGASWLHALGITSAQGIVLASSQDKWRQINKFLENIAAVVQSAKLPHDLHIADMGSGKGYLTFALYDYLTQHLGYHATVTGIELRPALVEFCNKTAKESGFEGLNFIAQDILQYNPPRMDMLIALHACDTATDLALAKGIKAGAGVLVVAPCCHKQIRKSMATRDSMRSIMKFGILEERQAEIITDGIRALLLESEGYKTHVFEFISTEHTAKNVLITAIKGGISDIRKADVLGNVQEIKGAFGIERHYLEVLLAGDSEI
ncbi:MAG: SAM-dependent methyltransferase [Bacteroidetes bacterium]|nr:SAM-dependent methyltransferase [Bacteroidota bacterium]